jgi:aspartate 1-decarboxylase
MLKSKIHRARVTECNVDYKGSIAIDRALMEAADILPYERVEVLNINNGARFSTYAIEADEGSGVISLNGAAARLVARDDIVIILTYVQIPESETINYHPRLVYVDSKNRIIEKHSEKDWTKDLMSAL